MSFDNVSNLTYNASSDNANDSLLVLTQFSGMSAVNTANSMAAGGYHSYSSRSTTQSITSHSHRDDDDRRRSSYGSSAGIPPEHAQMLDDVYGKPGSSKTGSSPMALDPSESAGPDKPAEPKTLRKDPYYLPENPIESADKQPLKKFPDDVDTGHYKPKDKGSLFDEVMRDKPKVVCPPGKEISAWDEIMDGFNRLLGNKSKFNFTDKRSSNDSWFHLKDGNFIDWKSIFSDKPSAKEKDSKTAKPTEHGPTKPIKDDKFQKTELIKPSDVVKPTLLNSEGVRKLPKSPSISLPKPGPEVPHKPMTIYEYPRDLVVPKEKHETLLTRPDKTPAPKSFLLDKTKSDLAAKSAATRIGTDSYYERSTKQ